FFRTSTPTTKWLSESGPLSESSSAECSSPSRGRSLDSESDEWRDGLRTQTSICRWSHKQPSQGIPESFRGRSADNEVGGTPMSLVQILMLVVLVVMFIAATKWPINIGIMGLVGAFVFGTFVFGMDDKEILKEFPASIVLTIVGVTFFFSIAQRNGTIRFLVDLAIRAVRGRINIVPW